MKNLCKILLDFIGPQVKVDKDKKYVEIKAGLLGTHIIETYYILKNYKIKII